MKFLIAGFGSIGRRHLRNLRALGQADIALYRTHQSTLPDDEIQGLPVYAELEQALSGPARPDGVIISNPTALHMDVAIPAARAGCHILMEKPISHNLDRLAELEEALRVGGGRLVVGFQFRFHPTLQQVRRLIQAGEIGQPVSARAHWGEYLPCWHPWEDYRQSYSARADLGGGVTLTLCHPLDYLRWLLGEIQSVSAMLGQLGGLELPAGVEDTAEIGLRFARGAMGSVHLDYFQRPPAHTLAISGTQGLVEWNNASAAARLYRAGPASWEEILPPPGFDRNDLFLSETRHFLAVMAGQAEPACTLKDGVQALRVVLAAHQASAAGKTVEIK